MPAAFREGGLAVGDVLVDGVGFDALGVTEVTSERVEHDVDVFCEALAILSRVTPVSAEYWINARCPVP